MSAQAGTGRATRRRAEIVAGGVLITLFVLVALGWWMAPGESGNAVGPLNTTPIPPRGDDTLTYIAVTAPDVSGAVTALILGVLIAGGAFIGLFFFSPNPIARQTYSSSAPGAVLETVMRNSTLLLVFFNRSTSRSMA